jgi:hypothetical protein
MSISRNIRIAGLSAVALVAASLFGAGAPARAQNAPTAFGQEMPQQYFLNRMTNPSRPAADGGSGGAAGTGASAAAGGGGAQAAAEDDDGPGPYPKRYLLNRLFGGGDHSAAPAPTAPAAAAK